MTRIERVVVTPPDSLLRCDPDPVPPPEAYDDPAAFDDHYIDVVTAGRSCRDRLRAVRDFVKRASE